MIPVSTVAAISLLYFGLLLAVAFYADKRRAAGRSLISNPTTYTLSLAVFLTSWTFYGSVGRASTKGLDYLALYIGPTLIAFTWWFLLRKMVRVSKEQNIVSIADFISSRYGKSAALGAIVTIFTVVGIVPYIALQLKAVSRTFDLLTHSSFEAAQGATHLVPPLAAPLDTAIIVSLLLGLFGILFGARSLDAAERHEGLVATVAMLSLVKLLAFLAVGLFVTYGLFDGVTDIFTRFVHQFPERSHLLLLGTEHAPYSQWFTFSFLSMMAVMCLPRQFHIMVIENSNEEHIKSAMWGLPAYMFLINLFVLPIAYGGLVINGGDTTLADMFVLQLPLQRGHTWLTLFVFIGGVSAAAGMVMVSAVTISTMILNHLLMPIILKFRKPGADISILLLNIKRLGIMLVVFLGYLYFKFIGGSYALANIGLVSFVAATQFAPSLIGGLFWKGANRQGAIWGLVLGFILWAYTLLVPFSVRSGWLDGGILENGLFGIGLLRPLELFGLSGLDIWTHSLFWTLSANLATFVALSLFTRQGTAEAEQVAKFVEAFSSFPEIEAPRQRISKAPTVIEFVDLMTKFIGERQARNAIGQYLEDVEINERGTLSEHDLPELKRFAERTLAGAVGAAPARIIVENYLATRGSEMQNVFDIFGTVTISRKAGREQLGVLYEATRMVARGGELQTILDELLELFRQQFKFDLCVIRMLDEKRSVLKVCSQKGMSSEHLGQADRALDNQTYIGEAFVDNSPVVVNDTDFMAKPRSAIIIHREGILSFAHAPITVEGEPVGVLSAFSKSARGIFTDEFTELFQSLAGQIGVAWRNAKQTEKLIEAREKEREMQIARAIQLSLLPATTPELSGVSLAGICVPAREVGGDYYDYLPGADSTLDLVIADVSGHNVGAALIMTETRTLIQARAQGLKSASETVHTLNEFLYDDLNRAELFITLFYLKYHPVSRQLSFASAGHNPPILMRGASGACERLDPDGMILGIKRGVSFEEQTLQLHPGDLLVLYTDGITEAEDKQGGFFGEERLCELLRGYRHLEPQQLIDRLLQEVRLFSGTQNLNDDVTLVIMRVED